MLVLPARQGAVVRVGSPSATGSSGACWFSLRDREQWCVLVLPARQGAVVRVGSPCATGSSGIYVIDSSLLILLFVVSFDSHCFRSVGFWLGFVSSVLCFLFFLACAS